MAEEAEDVRVVARSRHVNSAKKGVFNQYQIAFTSKDNAKVDQSHNDALVISIKIEGWTVRRVLVDPGTSTQIMFSGTYERMVPWQELTKSPFEIVGFNGSRAKSLGEVTLPVVAADVELGVTIVVINSESPYNAILGRGWIHAFGAVPSTLHQIIRFPTKWGMKEIRGEPAMARRCDNIASDIEPSEDDLPKPP